jgi:GH15 family glucan-1,4-alpha-glucosidase
MDYLEGAWQEPDEGIWEIRGPRRHFTHSKVMAWVAFDRGIRAHDEYGRDAPVDRWREIRAEIEEAVHARGWSDAKQSFTQTFDSDALDASALVMPLVGFISPTDPKMLSTVAAIEKELLVDGLVLRYRTEDEGVDGLPAGEGVFLACSFWLVEVLALQGRADEAQALFERLLALRNDVGLLAEEYEPRSGRQLGNFPQAFTHLALVEAAIALGEGRVIREAA